MKVEELEFKVGKGVKLAILLRALLIYDEELGGFMLAGVDGVPIAITEDDVTRGPKVVRIDAKEPVGVG